MMNKDLMDQIPAEEQPIAAKLNSLVEELQISQVFQWELENQLMDKAKTAIRPAQGWFTKIMVPLGWAVLAGCAIFLLNWTIRSLVPKQPSVAGAAPTREVSFEANVRTGHICAGPLAIGHGFAVFLTNPAKTDFVALDPAKTIGELRSFTWSADGKQLAILGNTTGNGNIYITDSTGEKLQPVLSNSELDYLMDAAWSRDGDQFVMWSAQNNKTIYLLNADGTGLVEKQMDMQILSTPEFAPDGKSIIFYGAGATSAGLFEAMLDSSQIQLISPLVEDETSFSFSPDGSHLAFMEMDRALGEARLVSQEIATGNKTVLGTLSIPKGSGSSIPESANLNWSPDGKSLVFDFGRGASDRAIYLAHPDSTELLKVINTAYAPSISADGKCLAYISDKKVFLLDLSGISLASTSSTPVLLADLPTGRSIADYRLDKLHWQP
jgi:Tol biopolymer transport system component